MRLTHLMHPRRFLAGGVVAAIAAGLLTAALFGSTTAGADTVPVPNRPLTVSADALAAPQTNQVVWDVAVVGNTVFATGNFTSPRSHMLAFDIRTGALLSFNHTFNGQGLVLAASPDGNRIFVGGDFTTVDGQPRSRVAMFNAKTFALSSYAPVFDGEVRAITVATNNYTYFGGDFESVSGNPRNRLAALGPNGGLAIWHPTANSTVNGLTMSPDQSKVFAVGRFSQLAAATRYGLGPVNTSTGSALPWPANFPVKDFGPNAALNSVKHDSKNIYVSGYDFTTSPSEDNGSNFEGRAAVNPSTGAIVFIDDCHGDTYDTFPIGDVLYSASHSHDCTTQGAFPETNPRTNHFALASTTYPTHQNLRNQVNGYADFSAFQGPGQLTWYPTFTNGNFTTSTQAVWCVSGNADYVVYGGEFPTVNGVRQVGLVRFAVRSLTTNKRGPQSIGAPRLTAEGGGKVLVDYNTTWDQDNGTLLYSVYRDNTRVNVTGWDTRFWRYGTTIAFTDSGVSPGTHSYHMVVSDQTGNVIASSSVNVTAR